MKETLTLKEAQNQVKEIRNIANKAVDAFFLDNSGEWFTAKQVSEGLNGLISPQHFANVVSNKNVWKYNRVPLERRETYVVVGTHRYALLDDDNNIVKIFTRTERRNVMMYRSVKRG